jgi:hypothetical protein
MVVFIHISLTISDVENIFHVLVGNCVSSFEKCQYWLIAHFQIVLFAIGFFELLVYSAY